MKRLAMAALAFVVVLLPVGRAAAEPGRRVALVIGIGAYQHLPTLANPAHDAALIADTLRSVGFELIGGGAQTDLDRVGFEHAIREFGAALSSGSVGLFYYAGHGLQLQGVNYLVPVGANPETAADADFELINAGLIVKQMEAAGSTLNMVILDACRNNPFGGRGLRDAGAGLATMRAPRGTLISYATQPGNVALDGKSGHSPFSAALAKAILHPGLPVLEVFNQVGIAVDRVTGGRQQPWVATSPMEGVFYFLGPTTVTVSSPNGSAAETERLFWQSIMTSGDPADFEEYLRQYPDGRFAGLARNRLTALKSAAAETSSTSTAEPDEALSPSAADVTAQVRAAALPEKIAVPPPPRTFRIDTDGTPAVHRRFLGIWGPGAWKGDRAAGEHVMLVIEHITEKGEVRLLYAGSECCAGRRLFHAHWGYFAGRLSGLRIHFDVQSFDHRIVHQEYELRGDGALHGTRYIHQRLRGRSSVVLVPRQADTAAR